MKQTLKHIIRPLLLAAVFCSGSFAYAQKVKGGAQGGNKQGGELGNVQYSEYESSSLGIVASYPEQWTVQEQKELLRFADDGNIKIRPSHIRFTVEKSAQPMNFADLKDKAIRSSSSCEWTEGSFAAHPAVFCRNGQRGKIGVLRANNEILWISFEYGHGQDSEQHVDHVLKSVEFIKL